MKLKRECCVLLIFKFCYSCALSKLVSESKAQVDSVIDLPDYFLLGTSTSAFQSEGAWNSSGKSESYIDWIMRGFFYNNASADVSSDSYHKYKEDVKVLNNIGLKLYRFSMSWPRLLPTGGVDNVNKEGVDYYHAVLDELEKVGVAPMVMLHHYDHPLILEKSGGWLNDTTVQLYVDYARFVFKEYGTRVKYFITFNEANLFCNGIYSTVSAHNDEYENTIIAYTCGQNILKAHAKVYHMYHNEFNSERDGMVSISIICENFKAKYKHDHLTADVAFEFGCGWIAHPIFSKSGDYPELMKQWVQNNSKLNESKLPTLSEEWINKIRGAADFFALSYYSSHLVEPAPINMCEPLNFFIPQDARIRLSDDPSWTQAANGFYVVPSGLRSIFQKIRKEYDNPMVYVIENGYANDGRLNDTDRIEFMYSHIKEIIDAIKYDRCDVRAYMYWSLIDSFEYIGGYTARFGLTHVDFEDPNRPRTLKQSAFWLRKVIQSRKLSINL